MSSYGTDQQYFDGYEAGAKEAKALYAPLLKAARDLLERWPTNKNLTEQIQALDWAVKDLPKGGRLRLDVTANPRANR